LDLPNVPTLGVPATLMLQRSRRPDTVYRIIDWARRARTLTGNGVVITTMPAQRRLAFLPCRILFIVAGCST
jgi:hypothetical protein